MKIIYFYNKFNRNIFQNGINFCIEMLGHDHTRNNKLVGILYVCVASLGRPWLQMQG